MGTLFQQLEMLQAGIVLVLFRVLFWNPDKYGNTTTDVISIWYVRILVLVDPIVPEDYAHLLASEDHPHIPSSFGGY